MRATAQASASHRCTRHHHKLLSTCEITHWSLLMKHLKWQTLKTLVCMWKEWHCYRKGQHYMQHPEAQPMIIKLSTGYYFTNVAHNLLFLHLHIKPNRWNDTFSSLQNEPTSAKKVSIFPQRTQEDPANQSQNCRGFEKRLTRCISVLQLLSIHECLRRAGSCNPAWGGNSNNWWREKRPLANNSRWERKTLRCFDPISVFSV